MPGFYDEWVVLEREHLNSIFEHHMARLMGAVGTQLASLGIRLLYRDKMENDRKLSVLQRKLDQHTFKKFWEKGNRMSLDDAIAFALGET